MPLSCPEALTASHRLADFSCGKPALDRWLQTHALSNQQKGFTAVMVIHADGQVVGYYGLAPTSVHASALPPAIRTGRPPDPVPCLLLGQLAVDERWAGQGIGSGLLRHALLRSVEAARLIGGRALIVNAIDEDAEGYWRRRGFLPSRDDPRLLFRSLPDIAASIEASGQ